MKRETKRSNNYKYLRERYKLKIAGNLPAKGRWVSVTQAAAKVNLSNQTIRLWYLTGLIAALKLKKGPILVNLDEIQVKLNLDQGKNKR